ncbi:hypothetical protein KR222_008643, partial [Zaprionus bogoriensis]
KPFDSASDSDDSDNEAQLRQFLEATDQTLLSNDMFQQVRQSEAAAATKEQTAPAAAAAAVVAPAQERPKSERYLNDDQETGAAYNDLQISPHMQTHIWGKLSAIIASQIQFHKPEQLQPEQQEKQEREPVNRVRLVSDAKCYLIDDIPEQLGPRKKPTIKRRRVDAEPDDAPCWEAIAVSGESLLRGQDMACWGSQRPR